MREENIKVVENFINALQEKDLSLEMLADDLLFEDPMTGKGAGADDLRAFLKGFLAAINSTRVHGHVCEGEFVVTHWEVDGIFGIIQVLEKFRVQNGKITEARAFFDPRPILGN